VQRFKSLKPLHKVRTIVREGVALQNRMGKPLLGACFADKKGRLPSGLWLQRRLSDPAAHRQTCWVCPFTRKSVGLLLREYGHDATHVR
jgi:hypothetical protein